MSTHTSIQSMIVERLERAPERRALAFYTADGEFSWIPLEEVHRRAAAVAAELAELGVRRGDVGLIVLPSGELAASSTLALLLLGAAPLLVAPPVLAGSLLDLPRILERTAQQTRARVVICGETMTGMRERLEASLPETRIVFDLDRRVAGAGPADLDPALPDSTDLAAMQLTSGTTGFPRICVWEQRAMLAALEGMTVAMKLCDSDVCLNWTPLYHDMGLVNNFLLCLTRGVPLVLMSPEAFVKRPALWPRGLADTESTITWSPNFGFTLAARRVKDRDLEGLRLDHVRGLWNAAERIHHRSIVEFRERYRPYGLDPAAVKSNFGCAENVGGATFSPADADLVVEHVDAGALHDRRVAEPVAEDAAHATAVVGVGRPNPGMRIEILADDGAPLPEGHVGEIALDTPSRMRGYLNDDEATRWAFAFDRLRTGDLGYLRGEELFWVGRSRERIAVRGKKIDPSDLEPVLFDVDGLRDGCFVAFGVDDERLGTQRLVVASEVREPLSRSGREIADEIREQTYLRLGLTIGEVLLVRPRTLAKTSSGKRRHRHFRKLYLENGLEPYLVEPAS